MSTILEELIKYRFVLNESFVDKYTEVRCPHDGGFIDETGHCEDCGDAYGRVCQQCKGINGCTCENIKEALNRLSLPEQLDLEIRKSHKSGNATKLFYYLQAQKKNLSACADYETFINSWAGTEWLKKNMENIQKLADYENNFLARQGKAEKWFTDRIAERKEIS